MNDEYIRRVEAEEAIEEYCCRRCKDYSEVEGGCISHAQHCEHLSGEEILKPVKSAGVQPVVHCKDCKYRKERHYEENGEKPYIKYECKFTKYSMSDEGFCSFGVKRDGDTECQ